MDLKFKHLLNSTDVVYKDDLADYVSKLVLTPFIECYVNSPGQTLNIEPYTMYLVQCFDTSGNHADLQLISNGGKNNEKGRFALIITAENIYSNLCILQTGSAIITNLVKTDSKVTGIKLYNTSHRLRYFKLSGYVAASK